MQIVIFIGIQATGKSTFFKERFVDSHIRINLDMLRTRHRERILVDACIEAKQPFVVDNTNPTREDRRRYIEPAREARFEIVGYFFRSRVAEAVKRNAARPVDARIPEAGIRGTASRLQLPSCDEGFDGLHFVEMTDGDFRVSPWRDDD